MQGFHESAKSGFYQQRRSSSVFTEGGTLKNLKRSHENSDEIKLLEDSRKHVMEVMSILDNLK